MRSKEVKSEIGGKDSQAISQGFLSAFIDTFCLLDIRNCRRINFPYIHTFLLVSHFLRLFVVASLHDIDVITLRIAISCDIPM